MIPSLYHDKSHYVVCRRKYVVWCYLARGNSTTTSTAFRTTSNNWQHGQVPKNKCDHRLHNLCMAVQPQRVFSHWVKVLVVGAGGPGGALGESCVREI